MALINAKRVGELLGIKARTVYDLTYSGRLACYRIGGAVRFDPADVEAFKVSCRVDARSAADRQSNRGASTVALSLRDPDAELARYFERHGLKRREKRTPSTKGNK